MTKPLFRKGISLEANNPLVTHIFSQDFLLLWLTFVNRIATEFYFILQEFWYKLCYLTLKWLLTLPLDRSGVSFNFETRVTLFTSNSKLPLFWQETLLDWETLFDILIRHNLQALFKYLN